MQESQSGVTDPLNREYGLKKSAENIVSAAPAVAEAENPSEVQDFYALDEKEFSEGILTTQEKLRLKAYRERSLFTSPTGKQEDLAVISSETKESLGEAKVQQDTTLARRARERFKRALNFFFTQKETEAGAINLSKDAELYSFFFPQDSRAQLLVKLAPPAGTKQVALGETEVKQFGQAKEELHQRLINRARLAREIHPTLRLPISAELFKVQEWPGGAPGGERKVESFDLLFTRLITTENRPKLKEVIEKTEKSIVELVNLWITSNLISGADLDTLRQQVRQFSDDPSLESAQEMLNLITSHKRLIKERIKELQTQNKVQLPANLQAAVAAWFADTSPYSLTPEIAQSLDLLEKGELSDLPELKERANQYLKARKGNQSALRLSEQRKVNSLLRKIESGETSIQKQVVEELRLLLLDLDRNIRHRQADSYPIAKHTKELEDDAAKEEHEMFMRELAWVEDLISKVKAKKKEFDQHGKSSDTREQPLIPRLEAQARVLRSAITSRQHDSLNYTIVGQVSSLPESDWSGMYITPIPGFEGSTSRTSQQDMVTFLSALGISITADNLKAGFANKATQKELSDVQNFKLEKQQELFRGKIFFKEIDQDSADVLVPIDTHVIRMRCEKNISPPFTLFVTYFEVVTMTYIDSDFQYRGLKNPFRKKVPA